MSDELSNFINSLSFPEEHVEVESTKVAQDLEGLPDAVLLNLAGYSLNPEEEKLAMHVTSLKSAMHGEDHAEWLEQFEGSPLYVQAIALCEQDLEMEKAHLQTRTQRRMQEQQSGGWEQESQDRDLMRIQHHQLMLELHKGKAQQQAAMAQVAAPSMPGSAAPAEAPAEAPAAKPAEPEIPPEAPPEAVAKKTSAKVAALADYMGGVDTASLDPKVRKQLKQRLALMQAGVGGVAGAAGGALIGAAATGGRVVPTLVHAGLGAVGGAASGYLGSRMGGGLRHRLDKSRERTKGKGVRGGKVISKGLFGKTDPGIIGLGGKLDRAIIGKEVYAQPEKTSSMTDTEQEVGLSRAVKGLARSKMDPDQKSALSKGLHKAIKKEVAEGDPIKEAAIDLKRLASMAKSKAKPIPISAIREMVKKKDLAKVTKQLSGMRSVL